MKEDKLDYAEALTRAFTEYCVYHPSIWASASQQVSAGRSLMPAQRLQP